MTIEELRETLNEAYPAALDQASLEAFKGKYEAEELGKMVDKTAIIEEGIDLILEK